MLLPMLTSLWKQNNNGVVIKQESTQTVIKEFDFKSPVQIQMTDKVKSNPKTVVFVGDSRTVGMFGSEIDIEYDTVKKQSHLTREANSLKDVDVIAQVGKGYNWVVQNPTTYDTYIFWLGVNDLTNIDSYKSYYEELILSGKKVYLCTVGLVNESKETSYGYGIKNVDIESFNKQLKTIDNAEVIDVYQFMLDNELDTGRDGLHYTKDTYEEIYNFIDNSVFTNNDS